MAQREAAERMKARREQELRGIAKDWDGSIRGLTDEDGTPARPMKQVAVARRRRKKSRARNLVNLITSAVRLGGRRGRGSHRR
jgi:hypothetical protein